MRKIYMHTVWLDQVERMQVRSEAFQLNFYKIRGTMLVGGVLLPALVGLKGHSLNITWKTLGWLPKGCANIDWDTIIGAMPFWISILVAVCAAIDGFMKWGDRWKLYRTTSETLLSVGMQYMNLTGPFMTMPTAVTKTPSANTDAHTPSLDQPDTLTQTSIPHTHETAFPQFQSQVAAILSQRIETYFTVLTQEQSQKTNVPRV